MEDIGHYQNSNFENYENFARQIYDEYNDFDDKLLFQVKIVQTQQKLKHKWVK